MEKLNLAVIFGGQSLEHEVSLSSAMGVIEALDKNKYNVAPIAITKKGDWLIGEKGEKYIRRFKDLKGKENAIGIDDADSLISENDENIFDYFKKDKADLVLPILHGPYGEDGKLQGMLDMISIPYAFSGVLTNSLAMNKAKAKIIVNDARVNVAGDLVVDKNYNLKNILKKIKFPVVIKPLELGSSVGISIAKNKDDLKKGIKDALSHSKEVVIEEYIKGREFTVTVIGNENPEVLAITEIIPVISEFYDYKAKYEEGGSKHVCPADLTSGIEKKIKENAIRAYKALGCNDLSRADFIWDEKEGIYFIEMNTIPGMTPTSLAPEAAKVAGMSFTELLDKLIKSALERNK